MNQKTKTSSPMLKINSLNYKDWLIASVLFTLTILSSLHYYTIFLLNLDEGIALYGAKRILMGQTLYKDFFDIVTPGTDYLLAIIFKLFGTTLKSARITMITANALNVAMLMLISSKLIKEKIAIIPPVLLMLIYITDKDDMAVSHHQFVITAMILTLLLLVKLNYEKSYKWIIPGVSSFLVFIFLQSTGLTIYGLLCLLFFFRYVSKKNNKRHILNGFFYFSTGFMLPLMLVFMLFFISGGLKEFVYDVFIWPWGHYKIVNNGSFFYYMFQLSEIHHYYFESLLLFFENIAIYFPALLLILSFIYVCKAYYQKEALQPSLIFLLLILISMFISELVNPAIWRFAVYYPIFLVLIFVILKQRIKDLVYKIFRIIGIVYITGGIIFIGLFCGKELSYYNTVGSHSIDMETSAGQVLVPVNVPKQFMTGMLPLFKAFNSGFPENSFIIFWSPYIYFLTGTNNPTMLNTYVPLYNTKAQVSKVIRQLQQTKPEIVIIDGYLSELKKEKYRNVDPEVFDISNDPLLSYIDHHYTLYKKIDNLFNIYKLSRD